MSEPVKNQASAAKAAGAQAMGRMKDALNSVRQPAKKDAPASPAGPRPAAQGKPVAKPAASPQARVGGQMAPVKPAQGQPLPSTRPTGVAPRPTQGQVQQQRPRPKGTRVRKARLRLSRIDPWSMMKTAFLFAVAGGIMFWVSTYVTWAVVEASGLFESLNKTVGSIINPDEGNGPAWRIEQYVSANKVLGFAAIVAVINVLLSTALATLGAFLYNLSASMLGGFEVTLAED